ncbi:MAG TPA: SusD/RagB family nutrient-binding outer membrane lipoprotein, partial [Sediminibacterium sp.]|nr:SusD/RagB family nutrient-binding outer membrane lipoprotein [Sediminibacterium sp.]
MKKILIVFGLLATLQSCNKFGDTNISPAQLTTASTKALLTNAEQALSTYVTSARLGSMYIQHISEGPYPGSSLYSDRNSSFAGWYTGPLYDLQTIINDNNAGSSSANGNG